MDSYGGLDGGYIVLLSPIWRIETRHRRGHHPLRHSRFACASALSQPKPGLAKASQSAPFKPGLGSSRVVVGVRCCLPDTAEAVHPWVPRIAHCSQLGQEPKLPRPCYGFRTMMHSELAEDVLQVRFDRRWGDDQFPRDLGVGQAGGDPL